MVFLDLGKSCDQPMIVQSPIEEEIAPMGDEGPDWNEGNREQGSLGAAPVDGEARPGRDP